MERTPAESVENAIKTSTESFTESTVQNILRTLYKAQQNGREPKLGTRDAQLGNRLTENAFRRFGNAAHTCYNHTERIMATGNPTGDIGTMI